MTTNARRALEAVAVVVTFRRPRLAARTVRSLIDVEGFDPSKVVVVVNGEGGLEDPSLETSVRMIRLPENLGPAGGFREGLIFALDEWSDPWVYLVEDDIGLFELPTPRVRGLLERARLHDDKIGAIVAYGRDMNPRTGITTPHVSTAKEDRLEGVDVAAWGATLVSRRPLLEGILPDPEWFFGYEDFDFFLRLREAGYGVLVDLAASRAAESRVFFSGREVAQAKGRPAESEETWRHYYASRNFIELARRHGRPIWVIWHLVKSVRRLQLIRIKGGKSAYLVGLLDGFRRRLGRNDRYLRRRGEWT